MVSINKMLKNKAHKFRDCRLWHRTREECLFENILRSLNLVYDKDFQMEWIFYTMNGESFYLADFYLPFHRIVFEIDGKQHFSNSAIDYDTSRMVNIESQYNIKIYRFPNYQLINKYKDVFGEVKQILSTVIVPIKNDIQEPTDWDIFKYWKIIGKREKMTKKQCYDKIYENRLRGIEIIFRDNKRSLYQLRKQYETSKIKKINKRNNDRRYKQIRLNKSKNNINLQIPIIQQEITYNSLDNEFYAMFKQ